MGRVIVENAAVAGKSLPPPTDVSWGIPPIVWDGYPNPVDADERSGSTPAGTVHVIPYPTNMAVGELVIACLSDVQQSAAIVLPAELTLLINVQGFQVAGIAGYRRWTGAEGATFTVTRPVGAVLIYHVYRIQNAHLVTPPAASGAGTSGANPGVNVLDPAGWGIEKTLWIATLGVTESNTVTLFPVLYPGQPLQTVLATGAQASSYAQAATVANPAGFWTCSIGNPHFARTTVAVRPRPPA